MCIRERKLGCSAQYALGDVVEPILRSAFHIEAAWEDSEETRRLCEGRESRLRPRFRYRSARGGSGLRGKDRRESEFTVTRTSSMLAVFGKS